MNRLALAYLLLAAACAPYQPMRKTWIPTSTTAAPHDQARAECRLVTMQDRRSIDAFTTIEPDGGLNSLSDYGVALMEACMRTKGYQPGPMVSQR